MNIQRQGADAYHLDQNVRGVLSSKNDTKGKCIMKRISERYFPKKYEVILPLALLEYAGIPQKRIFQSIHVPERLVRSRNIKTITDFFKNSFKEKLPRNVINKRLKDKLSHSSKYAKPFLNECISILPKTYNLIIDQLSWDRLSDLEWSEYVSSDKMPTIRKLIAVFLCNEPDLYALRYCYHLLPLFKLEKYKNESAEVFLQIIQEMKIESNKDIGDCELIHTAIHGQPSGNFQNKRIVDCYTMDNSEDIKRRLITCLFVYELLQDSFNYTLTMEYSGKIYVIDQHTNEEIDEIIVNDYVCEKVLKKIKNQDEEILGIFK